MSYGVEILYEDCHNSEPKNKNNLENININEHKINFYSKNNSLNNNSAGSSIKAKNDSENSDRKLVRLRRYHYHSRYDGSCRPYR